MGKKNTSHGVPVNLDDLDVVDIFEVEHPMSGRNGRGRVIFKTVDGLKLRDGTLRYGCKRCTQTYKSPLGVTTHQRREHLNGPKIAGTAGGAAERAPEPPAAPAVPKTPRKGAKAPTAAPEPPAAPVGEDQLDQTVALVAKLSDSRNEWRERAQHAERELSALRKRIKALAGGDDDGGS